MRKQLLEYDDGQRPAQGDLTAQWHLDAADLSRPRSAAARGSVIGMVRQFVPQESVEEQWDIGLEAAWPELADLAGSEGAGQSASAITGRDIIEKVQRPPRPPSM